MADRYEDGIRVVRRPDGVEIGVPTPEQIRAAGYTPRGVASIYAKQVALAEGKTEAEADAIQLEVGARWDAEHPV